MQLLQKSSSYIHVYMAHAVALRQASPSVEYHSCHLWYLAQFPPCLLVCSHGGATQVRSNLVDQFVSVEFNFRW